MGKSETTETTTDTDADADAAPDGREEDSANRADEGTVATSSIVEAMLVASDSPVGAQKMAGIIGDVSVGQIKECIDTLNADYERAGASFRVEEIAKGYQILTLPEYNVWLRKLLKVRTESKLSQAALETLAVIAYKQPALRAEIEEIRGVAVGEVVNRLREMNLVKIVGRAEELGRPLLYGTTKRFLEVFGLGSLQDLPQVEELTPPEKQRKHVDAAQEPPAGTDGDPVAADEADAAFARLAEAARSDERGAAQVDDDAHVGDSGAAD